MKIQRASQVVNAHSAWPRPGGEGRGHSHVRGLVGSEAAAPSLIRAPEFFQKLALQASQTLFCSLQLGVGWGGRSCGLRALPWGASICCCPAHLLRPFPGRAYSPALSAPALRLPVPSLAPDALDLCPVVSHLVGSCVLTGMCS